MLVAGLGLLFKGRRTRPAHLSVVTPRLVKVFEGTQELGSSPLEVELTSGSHTLRLSNEALGINQTVVIHCEAGQTCSVSELADAR